MSAEKTRSSAVGRSARSGRRAGPTYSSQVMWKFEPPKPNELTLARRGCALPWIHGRASVFT